MTDHVTPSFEETELDHYYAPTEVEIAEAVAQALAEISEMKLDSCKSFSELNDHIDANELAGICEERFHWTIEAIARVQEDVDKALRGRA
ncbi:hypothetical protein [Arthrobacter sp. S41]|uniref:hypothetical protein n=1 Tax=Arthrobacter sp. S41 TaxID=2509721 RepID=UPI0010367378|nr:hypothetical protein [Arthrobacter sp. S41]TAP26878.1 hypothetical protein EYR88_00465 [Arthrobacter sp. S41]